jgi:hypothetical protein
MLPPKRTRIPPPDSPIAEKSRPSDDEVAASRQPRADLPRPPPTMSPRPPSGGRYDQVGTTFMLDATLANTVAPEPARRGPVGGATRIGAKFFIRVTMGPRQRIAERAPWAKSQPEAEARGKVVQAWVNRLRAAGLAGLAPKFVESGARASEATLRKIAARVDSLVKNDKNDGTYRVEDVRSVGKAREGDVVTFRNFAERWTDGELARLYPDHIEVKASVDDDVERFEKHIYPHVEDVPLVSFTREHADGVMAKLSPSLIDPFGRFNRPKNRPRTAARLW